jgi:molybdate transport system regulatory protein
MSASAPPPSGPSFRPRIRVHQGSEIALGPGKVDLLDAIERTGTLVGAAQSLGMSYMRAWKLLQTMNACFKLPLVTTARGGSVHGGAVITETGRAVLALYRRMEEETRRASEPAWEEMRELLAE